MFLLAHSLHLTGPLAVMFSVAMIGLRVFMRRGRSSRSISSRSISSRSGHGRRG
jgi:hypothetical protein